MAELEFDDPHRLASAGVVVGVDGSAGARLALHWAADFAAARDRELRIVHGLDLVGTAAVAGPYATVVPEAIEALRSGGRALVRQAVDTVLAVHPDLRVSAHVYEDSAAGALIELSARAHAVVLGATGTLGTLAHLGSTLLSVTAHAAGTVIVVRPDPLVDDGVRESGPVVVGVDCGPVSEPAIAAAFAEASERGVDLIALHVWSDWDAGRYAGAKPSPTLDGVEDIEESVLAERLAGWPAKYPDVTVQRRIYLSGAAAQLREWSKYAQLVVVGNRGRGGFTGMLLGSTAHFLIQHADCPVMVVHDRH
ncbi:universal stress protein [Nocardia seriolae]|uniref:Universal stress protein n=1 Tax=Nocardia seriolae TaxID=37332 RepID=A0A0B8NHS2_9NOCA|nr:universal stress protein [Nocardia seriolae]APA98465.1 Universal stress protein [Nocardia seriolae]MTJ64075.1 universal stress protein [Nocardia seriolae]MTJ74345.1 universal stress protein [Nocardia seriolae]MTJ88146.1 universal stress protein [Nocardia seriolae]MTK32135.1 universal stress protein [Nocardia seriolae]